MLDGRNDRMYVLRDNGTSVEIEKIVQLPDVTGYVLSSSILDGYLTANTDAAWDPAPYIVRTNDLHHIDVAQRETVTNAVPYYFQKWTGNII